MKTREDLPQLVKDIIYGLERDLFGDDVGQALLRVFHSGVTDDRIREMIHGRARKDRLRQVLSGTPFLPPKLNRGGLVLGRDQDGRPTRIYTATAGVGADQLFDDGQVRAGDQEDCQVGDDRARTRGCTARDAVRDGPAGDELPARRSEEGSARVLLTFRYKCPSGRRRLGVEVTVRCMYGP